MADILEAVVVSTRIRVLRTFGPDWKESDLEWKQMEHALSNEVYRCRHVPSNTVVLVRVYLQARDEVNEALLRRVAHAIGPKIYCQCDEGSVEEWIEGRVLTHDEIVHPVIAGKIARILRKVHTVAKVCHNDLHMLNIMIRDGAGRLTAATTATTATTAVTTVSSATIPTGGGCGKDLPIDASNADQDIYIIDWEYTTPCETDADWAKDIANHCNELMFDYGPGGAWFEPKTGVREQLPALVKQFCSAYFGRDAVADELQLIQEQLPHIHRKWITWAELHLERTQDPIYATYRGHRESWLQSDPLILYQR